MILFDTVTKKYPRTTRPAVDGVSLEVERGEFVFVVGQSGSGKSTLLRLALKEENATSGSVFVAGRELSRLPDRKVPQLRREIGTVFHDFRLLPNKTVFQNVAFALQVIGKSRSVIRQTVPETLRTVGLEGKEKRLPHELSGGEQQRVALGRALLAQPRLLLLDEPLASLDAARREDVLPYLERLRDSFSIPIVYVSHQFDEVLRLASRVVLLEAGRTVADGDIATVSRHPALRAIVGPDAVGAVVSGTVERVDSTGLVQLRIGDALLSAEFDGAVVGQRIQIQVLARDVILATEPPRLLSVRNVVAARIVSITPDVGRAVLVELDVGRTATLLARITSRASQELALARDMQAWVLIKAVSLRGHVFSAPAR